MTEEKQVKINELKSIGLGYRRIASELKLNLHTVKSYCRRNGLGEKPVKNQAIAITYYCKFCSKKIIENKHGRKKHFCNIQCKKQYYKIAH